MLNPKFLGKFFKIAGFYILRLAFLDLGDEIFIGKNVYSAVHRIIFIFGYGYPFRLIPAVNENFIQDTRELSFSCIKQKGRASSQVRSIMRFFTTTSNRKGGAARIKIQTGVEEIRA